MTIPFFILSTPFLVIVTASGYVLATVGMKLIATAGTAPGFYALAAGIVVIILAEVALLRQTDLALAYIGVMAAETLLVLLYAMAIGEMFTLRQGAGAAMVLVGIVALST